MPAESVAGVWARVEYEPPYLYWIECGCMSLLTVRVVAMVDQYGICISLLALRSCLLCSADVLGSNDYRVLKVHLEDGYFSHNSTDRKITFGELYV